jgi:hypothetical protein
MSHPDGLVTCEVCGEWTHPRADGSNRCPKHLPEPVKPTPKVKKT